MVYALDPSENAFVGVRRRECTAVAPAEVDVILEMARCLREIAAGRAPASGDQPKDG